MSVEAIQSFISLESSGGRRELTICVTD